MPFRRPYMTIIHLGDGFDEIFLVSERLTFPLETQGSSHVGVSSTLRLNHKDSTKQHKFTQLSVAALAELEQ